VVERSEDLGRLLSATRGVSEQLVESGQDLVGLLASADLVLDTLRTRRATIQALLVDLASLGEQLSGVVADTGADLAVTVRDLRRVTDLLEEHEDDLAEGLRTLAPSVRYFTNASGTGGWLDQYTPGAIPDNLECNITGGCE
jgi:phospholipid/cholesterol/gamma-HCH transport system substrate-binding protein